MIIDGQIPVLQMDMTSQTKSINIEDINSGINATLIKDMTLEFNPKSVKSRIVIQCSGNLKYPEHSTYQGFSSIYLTYEINGLEIVLAEIGPIKKTQSEGSYRFDNVETQAVLTIDTLDKVTLRIRANGKAEKNIQELVSYDFWYLQVQEFKF